ncbi:MAG: TolC family protein [Elusimicrobiota bacterium]|jgi:hypothetical protein|nr:TolC family protein [Elusimicrobiota bacterium]
MKYLSISFFLIFVLRQNFSYPLFAQGVDKVLTETSSIQTALNVNSDILSHQKKIEYAKSKLSEMRSFYFPQADLNLAILSFNNSNAQIASINFSQSSIYIPQGNQKIHYSTRVSAWQNIYTGGRISAANKTAKQNLKRIQIEEELVKLKVVTDVKMSFNEILYHRELLQIYGDKKLSKKKDTADVKRRIMSEQFQYKKAVLNLLRAIGLELNTNVEISGDFNPKIKNISLEKCLLLAYQFNDRFKNLQFSDIDEDVSLDLLSIRTLPFISAGISQEWTGEKIVGEKSSWYGAIVASIPILGGKANYERLKQEQIKEREAALNNVKVRDDVRFNIEKSFMEYNFWKNLLLLENLSDTNILTESSAEIIYNLNNSYYALELAVGVELDSY